jgi:hypothetical protein
MVSVTRQNGPTFTANQQFTVVAPTVVEFAGKPFAEGVKIDQNHLNYPGQEAAYFGDGRPGKEGVKLTAKVALAPGSIGKGEVAFVQVATSHATWTERGEKWERTTGQDQFLDPNMNAKQVTYLPPTAISDGETKTIDMVDSPADPVGTFTEFTRDDQFTTYVMYRPENGIWVTLSRMNWFWMVNATRQGAAWQLRQKNNSKEADLTGQAAFDLPKWTNYVEMLLLLKRRVG